MVHTWFLGFSKKNCFIPMKISLAFIWVIVSYFCTRDGFFRMGIGGWRVTVLWGAVIMVFCFQNCSELLWEKIVLMIEKIFWNSRLKPNNLQKMYSQTIIQNLIQIRKNNWDLGTAGKVRKNSSSLAQNELKFTCSSDLMKNDDMWLAKDATCWI